MIMETIHYGIIIPGKCGILKLVISLYNTYMDVVCVNSYPSSEDIQIISSEIKSLSLEKIMKEWLVLKSISQEELLKLNGRNKMGCDLVDYYFFTERLLTIGKKGIHFFEFIRNIEYYKTKKYIQTLFSFCDKNNRYKDSIIRRYYYIYGLCFGRINAFKITNALSIYKKYKPTKILDPFCGFGGRLFGALLENIDYWGYDMNKHLEEPYNKLLNDFKYGEKHTSNIKLIFGNDSSTIDYEEIAKEYQYDMILTSPPYKNIEIYRCCSKESNKFWDDFYKKVFSKSWNGLKNEGYFIININNDIYISSLIPLLGECNEKFLLTKTKKNSYDEYVYVWKK